MTFQLQTALATRTTFFFFHIWQLLTYFKMFCAKIKCEGTNIKILTIKINQYQQFYSYKAIALVQHLGKHIYIYMAKEGYYSLNSTINRAQN